MIVPFLVTFSRFVYDLFVFINTIELIGFARKRGQAKWEKYTVFGAKSKAIRCT